MSPVGKRIVTALTVAAAVVCAIIFAPVGWFKPVVTLLAALTVLEYWQLLRIKTRAGFPMAVALVLGLLGACFLISALSVLPAIAIRHGNMKLLYVIAIIKISDMGGFAFGLSSAKLMKGGNHKMCPSISPNKSWEGLFGSVLGSCLMSAAFIPVTHFQCGRALLLGVVAALVGTAGDLVESRFKRWVGVKDSSTMKITNGMGGFLDMFDSLLLAPAVLFALI